MVEFRCTRRAVGKMRNELDVRMTRPMEERFEMATDEGPFHGGEATAPPPLAHFIASLTGCLMTQLRAFSRRLGVPIDDLTVETAIEWDWARAGRVYETAPKSFAIDVAVDSSAPDEAGGRADPRRQAGLFHRTDPGSGQPHHPPDETRRGLGGGGLNAACPHLRAGQKTLRISGAGSRRAGEPMQNLLTRLTTAPYHSYTNEISGVRKRITRDQ